MKIHFKETVTVVALSVSILIAPIIVIYASLNPRNPEDTQNKTFCLSELFILLFSVMSTLALTIYARTFEGWKETSHGWAVFYSVLSIALFLSNLLMVTPFFIDIPYEYHRNYGRLTIYASVAGFISFIVSGLSLVISLPFYLYSKGKQNKSDLQS